VQLHTSATAAISERTPLLRSVVCMLRSITVSRPAHHARCPKRDGQSPSLFLFSPLSSLRCARVPSFPAARLRAVCFENAHCRRLLATGITARADNSRNKRGN
jgi:hypothetical protein